MRSLALDACLKISGIRCENACSAWGRTCIKRYYPLNGGVETKTRSELPNIWCGEILSFNRFRCIGDRFFRPIRAYRCSDICLVVPSFPNRTPTATYRCTLALVVKNDEQAQSTVTAWPTCGSIQSGRNKSMTNKAEA